MAQVRLSNNLKGKVCKWNQKNTDLAASNACAKAKQKKVHMPTKFNMTFSQKTGGYVEFM